MLTAGNDTNQFTANSFSNLETVVVSDITLNGSDLADSIDSIGKPKETRDEKIKARLAYEQWQQSSRLAS